MTRQELRIKIVTDCDKLLGHAFLFRLTDEEQAILNAQKAVVGSDDGVLFKLYAALPPQMQG